MRSANTTITSKICLFGTTIRCRFV